MRITQGVHEEGDHNAWAVVNFFMSEIQKDDLKFEAPYLELFRIKKDILALIREKEDATKKAATGSSRDAPNLSKEVFLCTDPSTLQQPTPQADKRVDLTT